MNSGGICSTPDSRNQCLFVLGITLSTTDPTGTTGSDETDLTTGGGASLDGRSLTDVLMVTTTVGMLHRVHGHTTHLRPAVALHLVLVVGTTGLQDGLVDTTAAGNDADHGAVGGGHNLLGAGGQLDTGLLGVGVVGNHGGVVARGTGQTAAITGLLLQVADDGTLRHLAQGHNVSDLEGGLATAVDELSGVHALGGDEQLLADLVAVGIAEVDDGQRSATAGIVDDVLISRKIVLVSLWKGNLRWGRGTHLDNTANVAGTLGEVQGTQLSGSLALLYVGLEDRPGAFTLCTNNATHCCKTKPNPIINIGI